MELVDSAQRARARTGPGETLAVEAGAGTGKTRLLVERILHGLEQGTFAAPQLAAITFTRKAAAEMRARVRHGLAARLEEAEGENLSRLQRARLELPLAEICTIHSFCARLLSAWPLEAGLDPGFRLVEETKADEQTEALWQEWWGEILADGRRAARLRPYFALEGRLEDLRRAAAELIEWPQARIPSRASRRRDDEALWRYVVESVEGFLARWRGLGGDPDDRFLLALEKLQRVLREQGSLPASARLRWLLDRYQGGKAKLEGLSERGGKRGGEFASIREQIRRFRDEELPRRLERHLQPLALRMLRELGEFRRWAEQRRRDLGEIRHVDLLAFARDLLRGDAEVLRAVRRRYRALLVDEFQDTDPLQAELVDLLTEDAGGPALFIVGDPKQSIYRFRQADVATYQKKVQQLEGEGRLAKISVNFRSRPALLQTVNEVAGQIFDANAWPAGQARWHPLVPSPAAEDVESASLVLLPLVSQAERPKIDEVARLEAGALAAELRRSREELGLEWRQLAVLFPATGRVHLLEQAFDDADVPYRQERAQSFFRRIEVTELAQVVGAIANPADELRVVAALRTRPLGVPDDALARHRALGGSFVAPVGEKAESGTGDPTVLRALGRVGAWHRLALDLPPVALLRQVIAETRFLVLLELVPGGERGSANLQRLLDHAEAHWSEGGYGLGDFSRWLSGKIERELARETESPAADEEDRVVLSTLHAAKGLEWELVAFFDTCHERSGSQSAVLYDRESGQAEIGLGRLFRTGRYRALADSEKEQSRAERARLLYVGMTRARTRLVIPLPPEGIRRPEGSLRGLLAGSQSFESWERAAREGRDPQPPAIVHRPAAPAAASRDRRDPLAGTEGGLERAERAKTRWAADRRRLLLRADDAVAVSPSRSAGPRAPLVDGLGDGRALGRVVHRGIEWWMREGDAGRSIEDWIRRAAGLEGLSPESESRAIDIGRAAEDCTLLLRARGARRRWCELPLSWRPLARDVPDGVLPGLLEEVELPEEAGGRDRRLLFNGVADLLFEDEAGLVLVDYKTGAWDEEPVRTAALERYSPQLALYAAAVAAVVGTAPAERWLLLLDPQQARAIRAG